MMCGALLQNAAQQKEPPMKIDRISQTLAARSTTSPRRLEKPRHSASSASPVCAFSAARRAPRRSLSSPDDINVDVVQFALNLEYLEAEYYLYATTGEGLPAGDIEGSGTLGNTIIKANPKVTFQTRIFEDYANEIATDEKNHVEFLRATLALARHRTGRAPRARSPEQLQHPRPGRGHRRFLRSRSRMK